MGKAIVDQQEQLGWGKSVVEQLSRDLQKTFEGKSGFSTQNLWYMRQFYIEYQDDIVLQQLVGELPWGQNLAIMSKVKERDARHYYLKASLEMGWSRNVLVHQIKSQAYQRHYLSKKQHNFEQALPEHLAEQADQAMKDVYMLDMLGVEKPILEAELESRIVSKIKDVMLELGYGFAFIANQYRIVADNNKEYFIDLLFSNRRLNSLVAFEIKIGQFKPEYAGKMNFYLNLLDDYVKESGENPSIGIILCTERDYLEVEYALRGLDKPVGVSEYVLTKELPLELQNKLPDPKHLEDEIRKEIDAIEAS
ncbi:MAG: PDDEXK nuclease domain-containing protein, partial [Gammaproteobacteria bacterium]|nr:PDDEXK nuclease domain-containing protein [Gammaproteobacteria bacterium]